MTKARAIAALGACLAGLPARALADDLDSGPCRTDVVAALGGQGQWLVAAGAAPAWQPSPALVGYDFVPFQTGGEWVDRDGAQVFASQWSWGDLVFSEGNWIFDAELGWLWLPDPRCVQIGPSAEAGGMMMPPVVMLPVGTRVVNHPWSARPSGQPNQWPGRPQPTGGRGAPPPSRVVASAPNRPSGAGHSSPNSRRPH